MEFLLLLAVAAVVWLWVLKIRAGKTASKKAREAGLLAERLAQLQARIDDLSKYQVIVDAEKAAKEILARVERTLERANTSADEITKNATANANKLVEEARDSVANAQTQVAQIISQAKHSAEELAGNAAYIAGARENEAKVVMVNAQAQAKQIIADAKRSAEARVQEVQASVANAHVQASQIIAAAKLSAEEIAGDAYGAMASAKEYAATAEAMKGVIRGYGDAYIVPSYSLLDVLADDFGHTDAGSSLKRARESTRVMVLAGRAAVCDYVEASRKETAVRFVVDAFNGKVDSILSRVKAENHGKLEQEIRGAFYLVNHNGAAFRNARIIDEYLNSRLDELKWAATAQALRDQEREEQRRLREQMREEEKAHREYEKAMKEAVQEESAIKKAMERVQQQVAQANEAQRAAFEAKLSELQQKLQLAEEKSQRALSMAQQTRVGHVYVISNIGAFGDHVFKIGMTRRLEPTDRVRELGDASVPFAFDIHAMIYSEDAPTLERSLHLHFMHSQVNKVNPRKEFFKLNLALIREQIEGMGITANWTMASEAQEYRETLKIEQNLRENPVLEREWEQYQIATETASDAVHA